MSSVSNTVRLVRRLRAHKLLPPGVPVEVRRLGRGGTRVQHAWSWYIIDAATKDLLGVASFETVERCASSPQWELERHELGFVLVRPISEQPEATG